MRPLMLLLLCLVPGLVHAFEWELDDLPEGEAREDLEYLGDLSANPDSPAGNPFSNQSWSNPYAIDAPRLYNQQGTYRGKLSTNPYDSDSISNPYGRYGSPYSPDSLNNPYGAGSPYAPDSPRNPYGSGWRIEGQQRK